MKILDCTLRDGGYYTNWEFSSELVDTYCKSMEALPVDYIEIGYRSIPLKGYLGLYFYCPEYLMKILKEKMPSKKLAIILNEKDINVDEIEMLLKPCEPYLSLIRIAVNPEFMDRAILLAKKIKTLGYEVAFNVMYMSNWGDNSTFYNSIKGIEENVDYFYMVDSYGGIAPKLLKEIILSIREVTNVTLGFHGHNNLEMALINSLTAIEEGVDLIDCTITGMGRGAGNLRTELLLTYLDSTGDLSVNFDSLSNTVSQFEVLKAQYGWGANLPYMFSGAFSLPQKNVMDWVGMNRYPMSTILNALSNAKLSIKDNIELPKFQGTNKFSKALIIGGGNSVNFNLESIKQYIRNNDICIIHAGVKHIVDFLDIEEVTQYYCLVGFESEKLQNKISNLKRIKHTCIYPPFPRKMGTMVHEELKDKSQELKSINFTKSSLDSPLSVAIQTALDLGVKETYFVGFDGYDKNISKNQYMLTSENQNIFNDLFTSNLVKTFFLTDSKYKNINLTSIHSLI